MTASMLNSVTLISRLTRGITKKGEHMQNGTIFDQIGKQLGAK